MRELYPEYTENASLLGTNDDQRPNIVYRLIGLILEDYINWEQGTCNFDSPQLLETLAFLRSFPPAPEETTLYPSDWQLKEHERFLDGAQLMSFVSIQEFEQMSYYKQYLGGETNYIGMPSSRGNGSRFMISDSIGITASCAAPELAWSFIRSLIEPEPQRQLDFCFPINRHAFDAMVEEAMTP